MVKKGQKQNIIEEALILQLVKDWILFYNTNRIRLK